MERTEWLDGLRGIAAAIVAFDHYFYGEINFPFRTFWASPAEENRRLLQLPPIKLLFAAHAMVPLFFVISGYALYKNRSTPNFFQRLSSSVTRRAFRIYLPVLVIATASQILFFCNLFNWEFNEWEVGDLKPWTAPMSHVAFLCRYMMDNMNIITFQYNSGLNGQLWTMPVEVRGSCVVYLALLGMAGWKTSLRPWALAIAMSYFLWYGMWEVFGFLAGLYLAEIRTSEKDNHDNGHHERHLLPYHAEVDIPKLGRVPISRIGKYLSFTGGIYLMCLGDDTQLPPGYQSLALIQPSNWGDYNVIRASWESIGALMVVFAISGLPNLQRPLNSRFVQYLGQISFSLYLVHQSVFHLWRDPVKNFIWLVLHKDLYPGTDGVNVSPGVFYTAWISSGLLLGVVAVYAAHFYTRYVDMKCLALTKRVEKFLSN